MSACELIQFNYTQNYIDECRSRVAAQVFAYNIRRYKRRGGYFETVLTISYIWWKIRSGSEKVKCMNESEEHFRVTMFLPLRDNDGNAFEEEIWEWLRNELTKTLSGFTDLGVVSGRWQGQSDQNRWIVAVVESAQQVDELRTFLKSARQMFRQDAMYFEWHPVHFELVT